MNALIISRHPFLLTYLPFPSQDTPCNTCQLIRNRYRGKIAQMNFEFQPQHCNTQHVLCNIVFYCTNALWIISSCCIRDQRLLHLYAGLAGIAVVANGLDTSRLTLLFYETYSSCRNAIGSHHTPSGTELGQNKKVCYFSTISY